jgi:hypothetical protein
MTIKSDLLQAWGVSVAKRLIKLTSIANGEPLLTRINRTPSAWCVATQIRAFYVHAAVVSVLAGEAIVSRERGVM